MYTHPEPNDIDQSFDAEVGNEVLNELVEISEQTEDYGPEADEDELCTEAGNQVRRKIFKIIDPETDLFQETIQQYQGILEESGRLTTRKRVKYFLVDSDNLRRFGFPTDTEASWRDLMQNINEWIVVYRKDNQLTLIRLQFDANLVQMSHYIPNKQYWERENEYVNNHLKQWIKELSDKLGYNYEVASNVEENVPQTTKEKDTGVLVCAFMDLLSRQEWLNFPTTDEQLLSLRRQLAIIIKRDNSNNVLKLRYFPNSQDVQTSTERAHFIDIPFISNQFADNPFATVEEMVTTEPLIDQIERSSSQEITLCGIRFDKGVKKETVDENDGYQPVCKRRRIDSNSEDSSQNSPTPVPECPIESEEPVSHSSPTSAPECLTNINKEFEDACDLGDDIEEESMDDDDDVDLNESTCQRFNENEWNFANAKSNRYKNPDKRANIVIKDKKTNKEVQFSCVSPLVDRNLLEEGLKEWTLYNCKKCGPNFNKNQHHNKPNPKHARLILTEHGKTVIYYPCHILGCEHSNLPIPRQLRFNSENLAENERKKLQKIGEGPRSLYAYYNLNHEFLYIGITEEYIKRITHSYHTFKYKTYELRYQRILIDGNAKNVKNLETTIQLLLEPPISNTDKFNLGYAEKDTNRIMSLLDYKSKDELKIFLKKFIENGFQKSETIDDILKSYISHNRATRSQKSRATSLKNTMRKHNLKVECDRLLEQNNNEGYSIKGYSVINSGGKVIYTEPDFTI